MCESVPEFSNITIIGKFVYSDNGIGGFFATRGRSENKGWVLVQGNSVSQIRCGEYNYQGFSVEDISNKNLIIIANRNTNNLLFKAYINGQKFELQCTDTITAPYFVIGTSDASISESGRLLRCLKGVFYSTYVFNRSLSDDEMQTFVKKYIDPDYVLPTE